MIAEDKLISKINRLPPTERNKVADLVDALLRKRGNNTSPRQKAESIERWAKSHNSDTPVILDDRREIIYED